MCHSMKPDLRADYKIRLYTGPQTPFFEVSALVGKGCVDRGEDARALRPHNGQMQSRRLGRRVQVAGNRVRLRQHVFARPCYAV